jgi:hypothetical protein
MKTFDSEVSTEVALEAREREASGQSRDLFSARPAPAIKPRKMRAAPELTAARVLCNQLKRKRASTEKKRIIHLICLNLVTILKRGSPQA